MNRLKNGMKIIDYYTLYRDDIKRLEVCLNNFNYEDACPYCLKLLSKYKQYNIVLNKDFLLGASESIWDFTINDLSCLWIWEVDTWRSRIKINGNPSSLKSETLEKIMQDLCDILNMLVENGELESTDDTSEDWQPKHY